MTKSPPAEEPANYPELFRSFIVRSAVEVLRAIGPAPRQLSGDDRDAALYSLSYALGLDAAWPVARQLLLRIAPLMEQAGFRDDWARYLVRGVECSQAAGDGAGEAELRWHLGVLHQLLASYEAAGQELLASAALYEDLGDRVGRARALNRLAFVARRQRRFEHARELLDEATALTTEADAERAYTYLVLGSLALDAEAWPAAAEHFRRAIAQLGARPDERLVAWNLTNLGFALWHDGQLEAAAAAYWEAIGLYETVIADAINLAVARLNLGVLLLEDRPADALNLWVEAEKTFRAAEDLLRLAKVRNDIGLACTALQRWEEAEVAFEASIECWRTIGDPQGVADTLDGLGQAYVRQGRCEEAVVVYHEALGEIDKIREEPGYAAIHAAVTGHLCQAMACRDRTSPD